MLATAADDRTVRVWETATGRELFVLAGHTGRVLSAEFSPDGTSLYSTGLDRTIFTWDLDARRTIERTLLPSTADEVAVESIALTSDESTFVAIGIGNAQLVAVDLASGRAAEALDTGHGVTYALLPSGGSTVITGGDDGSIRRWNASTGELLAELTPHDDAPGFFPLAVTSDAETVYLQNGDNTLQAYDAVTLAARPGTRWLSAPGSSPAPSPQTATHWRCRRSSRRRSRSSTLRHRGSARSMSLATSRPSASHRTVPSRPLAISTAACSASTCPPPH